MKTITHIESIEEALYDLIHFSHVPAKAQAQDLGVSYSRFLNCCIPSAESAYHHTRWIIPQTLMTGNTVLIDYIEQRLGRVAVPVLDSAGEVSGPESLMTETMKVAEEMGQMAAAMRESFEDGRLTPDEAARCKKKTWDLIRQAVKVYKHLDRATKQR